MIAHSPQPGFTLAELLIALALLGIIAAFTIPKVLQATAEQETNAKLRETVATLEQAWYNLRMTNSVPEGHSLYSSIAPNLNTIAHNGNSVNMPGEIYWGMTPAHPCSSSFETASGWIQFANGVVISGSNVGAGFDFFPWNESYHTDHDVLEHLDVLCIDVNGRAGPNLPGQDIFIGNFSQYGAFNAPPITEQESLRSFRWGNTGTAPDSNVMGWSGTAFSAGAGAGAISGIGAGSGGLPSHVVGSRLTR